MKYSIPFAALFVVCNIVAGILIAWLMWLTIATSLCLVFAVILFLQTWNIVYAMVPTATWIMGDE